MTKNIVLCSDGTGNRWGVGAQTNVSKLFQAVETGGAKRQIRFYDNGVGTSSNRYLRAITGAFGFGLSSNVLDLYEFLARHWQPGDQIYIFGFSRGAATVRGFAGMLQECGLVWTEGDHPDCKCYDQQRLEELIRLAKDAYRHRDPENEDANRPHRERFRRSIEASGGGFEWAPKVDIKLIGVWDTVSALGFPTGPWGSKWLFDLLEKGADRYFPHSFYNYQLDGRVERVCHALSIDDERRTFRPTLFNEIEGPGPLNIEQVWFCGMHSNVGGGYARSGLASVSLEWMMAHAQHAGLALRPGAVQAVRDDANPSGKMHDSRDGLKTFYRYMPRDLVRLCEAGTGPMKANGAERGPDASAFPPRDWPMAAEGSVKLHESVIERLHEGTARYAPGLLPRSYQVVGNPSAPNGDVPSRSVRLDKAAWSASRDRVLRAARKRSLLYHVFLYTSLAIVAWMVALWKGEEISGVFGRIFDALRVRGALSRVTEAIGGAASALGGWLAAGLAWVAPGVESAQGNFSDVLDFLDGPIDRAAGVAASATEGMFGLLQTLLEWLLPAATENFVKFVLVDEPIWLILILALAVFLFVLRKSFLTAFDDAAQKARKVLLKTWSKTTGHQYREQPLLGAAEKKPESRTARRVKYVAILIVLAVVVGAFRMSFDSDAANRAVVTVLKMLALPTLTFVVFGFLFRRTGRDPGTVPLNRRKAGYTAEDAVETWSARGLDREEPYKAEMRFLRLDLVFPLAYGAAFIYAIAFAAQDLGLSGWWRWLLVPMLVTVVADWIENTVHLRQLARFHKDGKLQEGPIELASRATRVKWYGLVWGGFLLTGVLGLLVVARAIVFG